MNEIDKLVATDDTLFNKQVSRLCRRVKIGIKLSPQLRLWNIVGDRRKELVVLLRSDVLAQ